MKYVLFLFIFISSLIVFQPAQAQANVYYVDWTNGNDNNDGLSEVNAWKTINKVNNFNFNPGDSILFKRGEIWREELRVPSSGSAGNPIIFGAYEDGDNPIISAADLVTSWILDSGNIYWASVDWTPNGVFQDATRLLKVGNKASMTAGSWFYDSGADRLYVWSTDGADPDTYNMDVSKRDCSVKILYGKHYIKLENLTLRHDNDINTYGASLAVWESNNVEVSNCIIERVGQTGITARISENFELHDSIIQNTGNDGIWVCYSSHNAKIYNNTFTNNGGGTGDRDTIGVWKSANAEIYDNTITNGRKAIEISSDDGSSTGFKIYRNFIGNMSGDHWARGISLAHASGKVYSNIIKDITQSEGIFVYTANYKAVIDIYHNTLYNCNEGIEICDDSNPVHADTFVKVKNNIVKDSITRHIQLTSNSLSKVDIDYNCYHPDSGTAFRLGYLNNYDFADWRTQTFQDTNSIQADPLFMAADDFHLQSNSPCINTGTDMGLTQDYEGNPLPQGIAADIGAFEYNPIANVFPGWSAIDTIYYDPAQEDPNNNYLEQAATELKTHLEQVSGTYNIVNTTPTTGISLEVDPIHPELIGKSDEAFHLLTDSNGITITGKTALAVRHGAYTLLEKLGFRWYFKHEAWNIAPDSLISLDLNEIQEPFYFWRYIWSPSALDRDKTTQWRVRNRFYGTKYYPVYHSYADIIPRSEFATNPEWFLPEGMTEISYPWQLKPDHPDVINRSIDYASNFLSQPNKTWVWGWDDKVIVGSVPISPNDGWGWDPPYGNDCQLITDKVFGLANEVAKAIQTDYPDRYVSLFAYTLYSDIPSFDLQPNILVHITSAFNQCPLTHAEQIKGMVTKGIEIGIYDYYDVWVWWEDNPNLLLNRLKRLTWYANQGISNFQAESGDAWGSRGLTYYAASKMLWDPYQDLDVIFDDFYTKAFGPAKEPMKRYYERYGTDVSDEILKLNFLDLAEAESLAAGNEEILERIRHLEYYQRYLWFWKSKGITNLNLDELKDFYTFTTKIRNLYIISNSVAYELGAEYSVEEELRARGLTDSEISILENIISPTPEEAATWLNEALNAFASVDLPEISTINPLKIELVTLGDTNKTRLEPLYGKDRQILVPSDGNEDITVLVKGQKGTLQWYEPTGLLIDNWSFTEELPDWTPVQFHAELPGIYLLHITISKPTSSILSVDIQDHPASILAHPINDIFKPDIDGWLERNAPNFIGENEMYFYVPDDANSFIFGAFTYVSMSGELIDPEGNIKLNFSVNAETKEWTLNNPTPGLWKISVNSINTANYRYFWLVGIPPLVWHDPEYLLVPAEESTTTTTTTSSTTTTTSSTTSSTTTSSTTTTLTTTTTTTSPPVGPSQPSGSGGIVRIKEEPLPEINETVVSETPEEKELGVSLQLETPDKLKIGAKFSVNVTVNNLDKAKSNLNLVVNDQKMLISLRDYETRKFSFNLIAPETTGEFLLTAKLLGEGVNSTKFKIIELEYRPLILYVDTIKYTNTTYMNLTVKNYENTITYIRILDPLGRVVFGDSFEGKQSYFADLWLDSTGDYKVVAETEVLGNTYTEEEIVPSIGLVEIERFAFLWIVLVLVGAFIAILMAYLAKRRMEKKTMIYY